MDRIEHYEFGNGWCILDWEREDNVAQFLFGDEPEREPGTVYEEYAHILNSKKNLVLPLSGGIDSETAAECCVREDISFQPLIMRLVIEGEIMNDHDIYYAELFCQKHGLTPTYETLDIIKFLNGGIAKSYARKYHCSSPQLATHLWLTEKAQGTVAYVGDFLTVSPLNIGINAWKYFAYDFYFAKTGQDGIAKILSHTPEIVAASVKLQLGVIKSDIIYKSNYERKCDLYHRAGFRAEPRKAKYTGFERILKYYQEKYNGKHLYDKFNSMHRAPLIELSDTPHQTHVWFSDYYQDLLNNHKKS